VQSSNAHQLIGGGDIDAMNGATTENPQYSLSCGKSSVPKLMGNIASSINQAVGSGAWSTAHMPTHWISTSKSNGPCKRQTKILANGPSCVPSIVAIE
jgi:hypothetical protein